jgi:hypothetical protein
MNHDLRDYATHLRTIAGDAIWATDLDAARQLSEQLEPLEIQFNEKVSQMFSELF